MNGVKAQGAETGMISLVEGGRGGTAASNLCSRRARLLASRPDKSYIIDMISRRRGPACAITSDTLNPSQIRFPNQPTSRLTAAQGPE